MISHKKRPILYIDDTVEQRYAMRRILETEDFEVLEAGTGKEALELMKREPAVAVVDVKLPDISGYDLSRQMKHISPHLQLLQVSASFSDPDLRISGLSGGADAYIAQPVHPTELVTLIRRMLRTAEAEEALRFLASLGPKFSESLSVSETAANICAAVTPHFANRCFFFLERFPGQAAIFWLKDSSDESATRPIMQAHSSAERARMEHSRLLVAPLMNGGSSLGSIAFELDQDREYTEKDLLMAQDLANRAAVAFQNCILFASEQQTRSALVQSEKLATAGRMAAAIAHEINNPLEALTNLIYLIERAAEANESIREMAGAALAEITRLAHITRQTLGFYRELRAPATISLSQSVSDALELYKMRLVEKRIEVDLHLEDTATINGIKGEIRQVVSNLLVNAIEAIEPGGKITIAVFARENQAVLSVSDNGPGIGDELVEKIFEPFFTTKKGTGTGLGLWITKSIIEKHGGKIEVSTRRSTRDHGTSFEVQFTSAPPSFEGSPQ